MRLPPGAVEFPVEHAGAGVYLLLDGDRVAYVGQSVNVPGRIGDHVNKRGGAFQRAVYLRLRPDRRTLDATESALIQALRPPLNKLIPWAHDRDVSEILRGWGW